MANLILCDLDGTLLRHGHPMSKETLDTLGSLCDKGDIVAIASGRSLYSGRNIVCEPMRISYWIFSTGVGILDWRSKAIVRKNELSQEQVRHAASVLVELEEDFMVQAPVPENHRFVHCKFSRPENDGTDFFTRCRAYPDYCKPLEDLDTLTGASQLIAILPADTSRMAEIRRRLCGYSVVRATSPMDGRSVWLEIFAPGVGKANGAAWLASLPELGITDTFAIGNDYNDMDMLHWANHAFITPNAPEDMKAEFPVTIADTEGALPEAARKWMLM